MQIRFAKRPLYLATLALAGLVTTAGCSDDTNDQPTPIVDGGVDSGTPDTSSEDTGVVADTGPSDAPADAPAACPTNPPVEEITADITANTTWTCQKTYLLEKLVEVKAPAVLTIGAGTTIKGVKGASMSQIAGLAILPGAKILAMGTKAKPIVFTSNEATRARGDWAGLMLLGKARSNHAAQSFPEGITAMTEFGYGGTAADRDDDDSSGELHYVRVEYAGFQLSPNNEINSFSFYGVGRGTKLDHLEALQGADDSFEFFGGTVEAKYLVASGGADDCLDMDNGYSGKIQFAICDRDDVLGGGNGFEVDNDATGSANLPQTNPTVWNVSLVGKGSTPTSDGGHGFHLRRNTLGKWGNVLAVNWPLSGLFIEGTTTTASATAGTLSVTSSIFGGLTKNGNDAFADAYLANPTHKLRTATLAEAKVTNTTSTAPNFALQTGSPALTGATAPPSDAFFDQTGKDFVGACSTTCTEFEGWTRFE